MAAEDVFSLLTLEENSKLQVGVSFYEIYCGKSFDLLNERKFCPIRVDGREAVNVVGLTEHLVENVESLMSLIVYGLSVRVTGQTGANDQSSRSHAVLQISIRTSRNKLKGKLNFIDLAGSERCGSNGATGQRFTEGTRINVSLTTLSSVISALARKVKL